MGTLRGALAASTAFVAPGAGLGSLGMGLGVVDPAAKPPTPALPLYNPTSYAATYAAPALLMQAASAAGLTRSWLWSVPGGGAVSPSPPWGALPPGRPGSWTITSFGPVTTGPPCEASAASSKVSMRMPITTAPGDARPAVLVPTYRTILAPPAQAGSSSGSCASTSFMEASRVIDVTTTLYLVDAVTGAAIWASPARPADADGNPAEAQNLFLAPLCALGAGSFVLSATNSSGAVVSEGGSLPVPAGASRALWGMARTGGYSWTTSADWSTLACGNASFYTFGAAGVARYTPPFSAAVPYTGYPVPPVSMFVWAPWVGMAALVFTTACRGK